jgi:PPOX class probable FMN-dependent enzyme
MSTIDTPDKLRAIYGHATGRAVSKEITKLEPHSKRFIELSPFLVMATSRPDGLADASPKGDHPGFVQVIDDETVAIPDRPGNNRLDTMENILVNPAIGLIFFIPGVNETLRINGTAAINDDPDLLQRFEVNGKLPKTVFVVKAQEVYLHCAKALMRSKLWSPDAQAPERPIPSMAQMLRDQTTDEVELESQEDMEARYQNVLY